MASGFRPRALWTGGTHPGRSGSAHRRSRACLAGAASGARLPRCIPALPQSEGACGSRRLSVLPCFCLVRRGDLLGGSEDLPPLSAGPAQLRHPAADRLSRLPRLRLRFGSRGFVHGVFPSGIFQLVIRPSSSPVQVDAEAQAGAAQVDHVALEVGELEAEVAQRDRTPDVDHVVLMRVRLHDVAHALLADDLGDDVVAQRAHRVGRVGQAAAAKVDLRVRLHLHEGEDLLVARLVDEAGAQQVVDAQGLAGRGALRVAAAAGELRAQLLVVQDQTVAVVGDLQLVARLHVSGAGEVAADPGGQARAGVGADAELCPVQRAQGGVVPGEVGAAVGAQEGVRHPDLEDTQPRGALQVHRFPNIKLKVRISSCHALP